MAKFLRFTLPVAVLMVAGVLVGCNNKEEPVSKEETAKLIAPVAKLELEGAGSATAAVLRTGQQVADQYCVACHAAGAAGAPKMGDKAAWAPRIAQGLDALVKTAVTGKGAMPPRGGAPNLQDIELTRAVVYLTNQAGAKFKEPAAPATAAAASAPVAGTDGAKVAAADGKKVYDSGCVACHAAGIAGAPKLGDKALWAPRIATGMPALYNSVHKGKGLMPPKAGNPALSDGEIKASVDYMVAQAK